MQQNKKLLISALIIGTIAITALIVFIIFNNIGEEADLTEQDGQLEEVNGEHVDGEQAIKQERPVTFTKLHHSPLEHVKDMKLGWNLGNTLDALGGETEWGNPLTTKEMIDEIKKAGFQTVRIPISWDDRLGDAPDYTIQPEFLKRVEEIVGYVLDNDMYAIINIHHHYGWLQTRPDQEEEATNIIIKIWEQVGAYFEHFDDRLIFETLNEPRDGDEWTGYPKAYDIVNRYNAVALETIRATGGNNTQRLVMIPTYAASPNFQAVSALEVPDDDYIAVSIHAYTPYEFSMAHRASDVKEWGTDAEKRELISLFDMLERTFISEGIPVVLGEFATTDKENLAARVTHAEFYVAAAAERGMPTIWWDNGIFKPYSVDTMGIFDRRALTWVHPEIVEAMVRVYSDDYVFDDGLEPIDASVLFEGEATSDGAWGQAVTFRSGSDYLPEMMSEWEGVAVHYEGELVPEFIVQSWSGGTSWAKVAPAKVEDGIAYFMREDMIASYGDETFQFADALYVGDTGAPLIVTKVYVIDSE